MVCETAAPWHASLTWLDRARAAGNSIAMGPAKIEMAKGVGLVSVNIKKISA